MQPKAGKPMRIVLLSLFVFLVGLVIGLVVLGWWLWPVDWEGGTLQHLTAEARQDYLRAAIDSYTINLDTALAVKRFNNLGPDRLEILQYVQQNPSMTSPGAIDNFSQIVLSSAEFQTGAASVKRETAAPRPFYAQTLFWLALLGGLAVIFLISLAVRSLVRRRKAAPQPLVDLGKPAGSFAEEGLSGPQGAERLDRQWIPQEPLTDDELLAQHQRELEERLRREEALLLEEEAPEPQVEPDLDREGTTPERIPDVTPPGEPEIGEELTPEGELAGPEPGGEPEIGQESAPEGKLAEPEPGEEPEIKQEIAPEGKFAEPELSAEPEIKQELAPEGELAEPELGAEPEISQESAPEEEHAKPEPGEKPQPGGIPQETPPLQAEGLLPHDQPLSEEYKGVEENEWRLEEPQPSPPPEPEPPTPLEQKEPPPAGLEWLFEMVEPGSAQDHGLGISELPPADLRLAGERSEAEENLDLLPEPDVSDALGAGEPLPGEIPGMPEGRLLEEMPEVESQPKAGVTPEFEIESPGIAGLPEGDEERRSADPYAHVSGRNLYYIEGVGPAYAQKLAELGLQKPADLLRQGATPRGRAYLAEQTGISPKLIMTWVNHCDLYRIPGIGQEYADLLEASGVDTVPDLATRNPINLHEKLLTINDQRRLTRRPPVLSQVESWVRIAKTLPRLVEY